MGQCEPKRTPRHFDLCSGRPGNEPENFSSAVRFIKTSKGLKWSLNSMSHPFIHFLCVCLGFSFLFFLRPTGQRRLSHSTPQCCSQDGESARGGGLLGGRREENKKEND